MKRLMIVEFVTIAVLAIVAALGFDAVFLGDDYVLRLAGAAVVGTAFTAVLTVRRLSVYVVALLSFVAFLAYAAVAVVAPNGVSGFGDIATDLFDGIRNGWLDLLTATLPAQTENRLLVVAAAVVWLAGSSGAHLAHRQQNAVVPILPALGVYTLTLLVAAGRAADSSSTLPVLAGMIAVSLLAVLLHGNRRLSSEPGVAGDADATREASTDVSLDRRILSGLPLIGAALLLSMGTAAALPRLMGDDAFDLRDRITSSVETQREVSPLVGFKAILARPTDEILFDFDAGSPSDALAVPRVRLATLEDFDGSVWRSSATFDKAGTVLPQPDDGVSDEIPTTVVRQRIKILNLDGFWLPAAARPVRIEFVDERAAIQFDTETQTLVVTSGSIEGLEYDVDSEIVQPRTDQFAAARVPGLGELTEYRQLPPGLPNNIEFLAESLYSPDLTDFQQAQRIETYLRENFPYDLTVPAGHSYGHLDRFLGDPDRGGTAEQFASAFAVLARETGLPTRIAVGFITTVDEGAQSRPVTQVSAKDVHAWPEIYFNDLGWISFDPTPPREDRPDVDADDDPISGRQGTLSAGGLTTPEIGPQAAESGGGSNRPTGWLILGALLLIALGLFALLVALKFILASRRRRRASSTSERVLSSWEDVLDRLSELGQPVPRTLTANEIATASKAEIGPLAATRMQAMVPLVSGAVFAPSEPASDRADEMAAHARAFRQEVFADRSRFTELKALVNLRPLLRSTGLQR